MGTISVVAQNKKGFTKAVVGKNMINVTIPDGVTSISYHAFYDFKNLTSVTIPDSVTSIGEGAFQNCESLESITIPDSVTSIGKSAFSMCTNLKSITIPDSVTSIGKSTFYACKKLKRVIIPDGVTSIGEGAFQNCESLESVTIPDGVTSIEDCTFSGCESLESITIPDGVTSIGEGAFSGCKSLESVTIPNGVTSIGYSAFRGCESLESVTIPDSVTSIGEGAFYDCERLESVTIPDGVTSIEDCTFSGCKSLESATISDGVTSIGDFAFSGCKSLRSITIPESVTSIGESAFSGCESLKSIKIPDSIISIGEGFCSGCHNLTSLTIPDGVTSIEEYAFLSFKNLTGVTIPDSVTSIEEHAFHDCESLKSVTISDGVTSIGDFAFSGCKSLESVTISDGVTSIGDFAFSGCKSLRSITIPGSVTSIVNDVFPDCLESVTMLDGVTSIGEYAFCRLKDLTSVTIPDSVTSIGARAFSYCESLESITIPDSVTNIGENAFDMSGVLIIIGISGSYAEKWAEDNEIQFQAQTSIPNRIQKEKPLSKPLMIMNEKSHVPQKAGENAEAMLNKFSGIDNIVSVSNSQKLIPFQESMKIGTHHITEGVQRIEVMDMWSVDIPTGYKFSLDSEYTGKSIGGENRPLVIMIDNEYSDFLYPYQSEINFVVFATRQVGFNGQPLNGLNSRGIIIQMNESIRRSTKNYKSIVETELISVQYVTVEHRKNESEFNISIFTQDTWFLAQFLFNETTLEKDERVKMVEDWMKTIEPLQKTSHYTNKSPKINTPVALMAQEFKTVSPIKNLYWHYNMLQNQKQGVLSRFAEVSINGSGTEFACLDLDTLVEADEYLVKVTYEADAGKNNYKCHKAALEMSRVFRVASNAFNYQQDREGEIRDKTMKRAYSFSALRSFAWTLGAYQETKSLDAEQISIDVLLQLGEFVKSRDWLNYTDKSHYNGLCDGGDLHMFYLPDKIIKYLVKDNVVDKNNVASLDNLRNDLSALEPIMRQIHEHLYLTRDRSQPLSNPLSDVLYAWCVLALAAEKAFFTEDGPMNCGYSQYND